jgi:hypothetical protein
MPDRARQRSARASQKGCALSRLVHEGISPRNCPSSLRTAVDVRDPPLAPSGVASPSNPRPRGGVGSDAQSALPVWRWARRVRKSRRTRCRFRIHEARGRQTSRLARNYPRRAIPSRRVDLRPRVLAHDREAAGACPLWSLNVRPLAPQLARQVSVANSTPRT